MYYNCGRPFIHVFRLRLNFLRRHILRTDSHCRHCCIHLPHSSFWLICSILVECLHLLSPDRPGYFFMRAFIFVLVSVKTYGHQVNISHLFLCTSMLYILNTYLYMA